MGYTTNFEGAIGFSRELSHREWLELKRMSSYHEQDNGILKDYTDTPETLRDSYMQWEPNEAGTALVWNGGEKFYDYIIWLRWLIKHYFKPHDIVLNGQIRWVGEDRTDQGYLTVENNKVTHQKIKVDVCTCPNCGYIGKKEEFSE